MVCDDGLVWDAVVVRHFLPQETKMKLPNFHLRHHLGSAANGNTPRLDTIVGQLPAPCSPGQAGGLPLASPMLWYPRLAVAAFFMACWETNEVDLGRVSAALQPMPNISIGQWTEFWEGQVMFL